MAVWGFETFMRQKKAENNKGWREIDISDKPIVIDGNQFCHQMFQKVRLLHDGQYAEFYDFVFKLLYKFKECNVTAYFIFEGVDKPKQLSEDKRERKIRSQHESRMPVLTYTVLYNALRDMEAQIYTADGVSALTCAQLANALECPVLSHNSSFYFFNITKGYIDFEAFFNDKLLDPFAIQLPQVEAFFRDEFLDDRHWQAKFFLFPAIIGIKTHYTSTGVHIDGNSNWNPEKVEWYIHDKNPNDVPEQVYDRYQEVMRYYEKPKQFPLPLDELIRKPFPGDALQQLPAFFHSAYRRREVPFMVCDALINRTQHHAISDVSERIRQCCYSVFGIRDLKVTEYRLGKKGEIIKQDVECIRLDLQPDHIEGDQHEGEKKRTFYSALKCTKYREQIELFINDWFFISTVIFWKQQASPLPHVVKALVAVFVRLSNMSGRRAEIVQLSREVKIYQIYNQKSIKEWQCIYRDAVALGQLLRFPKKCIPCPSSIFDENLALKLTGQLETIDEAVRSFIGRGEMMKRYEDIIKLVNI